jgi:tRNA modification GTPase
LRDDTIFALSSGRPPAGVAVVRLSGPQALAAGSALAGGLPEARRAGLRTLRDAAGAPIDRALVIAFPGPRSFTGEDVVELHVHGGPAVVAALLRALGERPGLRLAEPGEFSRRAFDNGRLDLSQAEGLADLVAAQTEAQRVQALAQAGGRLRERVEGWRAAIVRLMAEAEADLDFSDEGDVTASRDAVLLARLRDEIEVALAGAAVGERIRDGFTIAVVGEPNVGKSSLVNALARRDVAIVSEVPGTTRDLIEVALDLCGVPVTLIDTAGLRDSADPIEAEGIRRAQRRAAAADLVLHVVIEATEAPLGQVIVNKIDRTRAEPGWRDGRLHVSAETGAGLDALEGWLADWALRRVPIGEPPVVVRQRQRLALGRAQAALDEAAVEPDPVLYAEALRLAARALGEVTGRVGVEDILGDIFGRFCIGK